MIKMEHQLEQYNNVKLFGNGWDMDSFILLNNIKNYFWDYRFSTDTYELYYN